MRPILPIFPSLAAALLGLNLASCLSEDRNSQEPPGTATPSQVSEAGEWIPDEHIESKELREVSRKATVLQCGEREVMGTDGKVHKDILTARPEVINYALDHSPALVRELGFNRVSTCGQAADYFAAQKRRQDARDARSFSPNAGIPVPANLPKIAIRGGTDAASKVGVVEFGTKCTGYMISPYIIVTAAHCLDQWIPQGDRANIHLDIRYFDPDGGVRTIASSSGTFPNVEIVMAPTFSGSPLDTESDVGYINSLEGSWPLTNDDDYLKIYMGSMSNARYSTMWGAGINSFAGEGFGTLRFANIYIDWYGTHHVIENTGTPRICDGDSGGPWIRTSGSTGSSGPDLVVAHTSNHSSNNVCAEAGSKTRATRMNTKIGWIASEAMLYCEDRVTATGNLPYKQCW